MKRRIFCGALSFLICLSFLATSQIAMVHVSAAAGNTFYDGSIRYEVLSDGASVELMYDPEFDSFRHFSEKQRGNSGRLCFLWMSKPYGNQFSGRSQHGINVFQQSGLQNAAIPSAITVLPSCTFYGCRNLAAVSLPDNMTGISDNAFNYSTIQSINLPANLTTIG